MIYYLSSCCNKPLMWWNGKVGQCTLCFEWVEGVEATESEAMKYMNGKYRKI